MARRTKEEAEQTRAALLNAAEQVFMEKGVAAASLDEIARHAGVTRGAVYWHFENKHALFDAMHERVKLPIEILFEQAVTQRDPVRAYRDLCVHCLSNLAKDEHARRVYTILMFKCEQVESLKSNRSRQEQKRAEVIARAIRIFSHAEKNGQLREGLTADTAATALHAYMSGILTDYLRNPEQFNIGRLAAPLVDVFFEGILRK